MKKALFVKDTGEVIQWQDWELYNYAEPPEWADLIDVNEEIWRKKEEGSFWYIMNGQFIRYDERPKFSPIWDVNKIKQFLKDIVQGTIQFWLSQSNITDGNKIELQNWANQKNAKIDNAQTREELEKISLEDYPKFKDNEEA